MPLYFTSTVPLMKLCLLLCFFVAAYASNLYQDFDLTWGDGRAKILNNGQLLTLSLDKASGSGFQSKNEYLFGKIDMQLKLVPGNSAGTVTAYYIMSYRTSGSCFRVQQYLYRAGSGLNCIIPKSYFLRIRPCRTCADPCQYAQKRKSTRIV